MLDFYRFTHFQKYPSIIHAVTKKSSALPCEFSLALHTGEDTKKIVSNRMLLSKVVGEEKNLHFIVANQTHSANIKVISHKTTKGWESLSTAVEDCDALISNIPGLVLCILTADCVPVLLYDKEKKLVAAIHAGWRGTKAEIVLKTVQKMEKVYGCDPKDIIAGIAPSIDSCCYEVGKDVAEHFFDIPDSLRLRGEKYMLDLPYINRQQLLKAGLNKNHIEMSNICTACAVSAFFSYRKEKGCTGRFMSMIGLCPSE